MGLFPGSDSGIERLTITAHQKVDCSDSSDKVFVCQVNPERLKYDFGIEANDGDSANGSSGTPSGFKGFVKMNLDFEFYADATGIVPIDDSMKDYFGSDDAPSIKGYLDLLQNILYGYDEEIHSPPYLSFTWGNIFPSTANDSADSKTPMFKGKLDKCSVEILLFSISGEPIKAKINITIQSEIDPAARPMGNSPDVTHFVDVGFSDKMTFHCNKIYGRFDSKICAAVAEYNDLVDWELQQGKKMVFPSIHLLNEKYLDKFEDVELKMIQEESEEELMMDLIGEKKSKQYYSMFNNKPLA